MLHEKKDKLKKAPAVLLQNVFQERLITKKKKKKKTTTKKTNKKQKNKTKQNKSKQKDTRKFWSIFQEKKRRK